MTAGATKVEWDPFDRAYDAQDHEIYQRMRDEAPLYRNDEMGFYVYSRHADVRSGLLDWQTYSSLHGNKLPGLLNPDTNQGARNIAAMDPPEHDVHRGTLAGVFTPRRVAELEPRMGELCGQLLDRYVGSDGFEFIHAFAAPFPMAVIGAMLSIRSDDFAELSESFMHHGAAGPAFVKLQDYFREVVDEQRASPTDSLVGDLVQARIPDGETDRLLTDDEILVQLGVLAFGGAETTNRLLGWSMVVLADHPDQRQELQSFDDDLLKGAFEELLRFQPPNIYAGRFTTRDVEKYGEVVPEGSPVVFLLPAAGRDERVFDDPHRFDIHRPTAANQVGFGAGPHYCLGAALARLEGRVALREIVRRWPEWHVDLDRSERVASPQVRGFNALWVVPGA